MEDSDSSDEQDTDETDPDDVRDYIRELQQEATSAAMLLLSWYNEGEGIKGWTQKPPSLYTRNLTL